MKKVLILGDSRKPRVNQALSELLPSLRRQVECAVIDLADETAEAPTDAHLAIALGGDGAILAAARHLGNTRAALAGVNVGKLGFLTSFTADELDEVLPALLRGEHPVQTPMLIDCRVVREGQVVFSGMAVNDAVVSRGAVSRIIDLKLLIHGEEVTAYAGDGLIVATPLGSTAHSLSAGGPIVPPELEAIIITPICPHTLSNRPLVVPASWQVEVEVTARTGIQTALTVDGQVFVSLRTGDLISVQRSSRELRLVRRRGESFFGRLRDKMQWKGHPNYA